MSDLVGTPATGGTTVSPEGPQALQTGCLGACRRRSRMHGNQGRKITPASADPGREHQPQGPHRELEPQTQSSTEPHCPWVSL